MMPPGVPLGGAHPEGTPNLLQLRDLASRLPGSKADLTFVIAHRIGGPEALAECVRAISRTLGGVVVGAASNHGVLDAREEHLEGPVAVVLAGNLGGDEAVEVLPFVSIPDEMETLPDLYTVSEDRGEQVKQWMQFFTRGPSEPSPTALIFGCGQSAAQHLNGESFLRRLDNMMPSGAKLGGIIPGAGPGSADIASVCICSPASPDGSAGGGEESVLTVMEDGAVGVVIDGKESLQVDCIVCQGAEGLGTEMLVTEADGDTIIELDGDPARERFMGQLHDLTEGGRKLLDGHLMVGLKLDGEASSSRTAGTAAAAAPWNSEFVVRGEFGPAHTPEDRVLGRAASGIRIPMSEGAIPPGTRVKLHSFSADAAERALTATMDKYAAALLEEQADEAGSATDPAAAVAPRGGANPVGGLLVTCLGRGPRLFGGRSNVESSIIRKAVVRDRAGGSDGDDDAHAGDASGGGTTDESGGGSLPLVGYFAGGEVGPLGSRTYMHTFTSCLALFAPKR
eukprot:g2825.t1